MELECPTSRLKCVVIGSIWDGADMWATAGETSDYVIGLYRRACVHADRTIDELDVSAPGRVAHWPDERRDTTLGALLARMVAETAQHAGHAEIVREMIDGHSRSDPGRPGSEEGDRYVARIQAAADAFASTRR